MGDVRPLPTLGGVFFDARGDHHVLRVSWHPDADIVVLSVWEGNRCTSSVRLPSTEVPELIHTLALGLVPASRSPEQADRPGHRGHLVQLTPAEQPGPPAPVEPDAELPVADAELPAPPVLEPSRPTPIAPAAIAPAVGGTGPDAPAADALNLDAPVTTDGPTA